MGWYSQKQLKWLTKTRINHHLFDRYDYSGEQQQKKGIFQIKMCSKYFNIFYMKIFDSFQKIQTLIDRLPSNGEYFFSFFIMQIPLSFSFFRIKLFFKKERKHVVFRDASFWEGEQYDYQGCWGDPLFFNQWLCFEQQNLTTG